MKEILSTLCHRLTGEDPIAITALTGAGSNRQYFRLELPQRTLIGVVGTSADENRAFIALSRHFRAQQLAVPEVLAVSTDGLCYLQTDLGSTSLYDHIAQCHKNHVWDDNTCRLLHRVMTDLPALQWRGADGLDFTVCYPQQAFDRRTVLWDLNYFKYCFLKATGVEFSEALLETDFAALADDLLADDSDTFMYRDFQSRNIMIVADTPYYIDYQGGRRGPIYYDVASFLWQARAAYPPELRESLLESYLASLAQFQPVDAVQFRCRLALFALFRLLQVLGAYGFRGYFERKAMFVVTIPAAIAELVNLLDQNTFSQYPTLVAVLRKMVTLPQFATPEATGRLVVRVTSFSYKRGIPDDYSGNGGGFVFDCRSTNNPGRYEPYKKLTGLDEPVIRFLEDDGEIVTFLQHVYEIIDPVVERYRARGFTSLMVSFGCTGGQHRSVYAAQHLAEHIATLHGVEVHLQHREQNREQVLNGVK